MSLQIYYDHILIKKLSNLNLSIDTKTQIRKLTNLYQNAKKNNNSGLCQTFFLLFSVNSNKQNTLVNNNQHKLTPQYKH